MVANSVGEAKSGGALPLLLGTGDHCAVLPQAVRHSQLGDPEETAPEEFLKSKRGAVFCYESLKTLRQM